MDELRELSYESERSGVIIPDRVIDDPRPEFQLPQSVRKLHGCRNCEWRGTKMCAFGFIKSGCYEERRMHSNGICLDRERYLKSFAPPGARQVSYQQWANGFNTAMAQGQLMDDWRRFQDALSGAVEPREVRELRQNWLESFTLVQKDVRAQLDRDAPKKLEIDRKVTPNDVIVLMRGWKEVDDGQAERVGQLIEQKDKD